MYYYILISYTPFDCVKKIHLKFFFIIYINISHRTIDSVLPLYHAKLLGEKKGNVHKKVTKQKTYSMHLCDRLPIYAFLSFVFHVLQINVNY